MPPIAAQDREFSREVLDLHGLVARIVILLVVVHIAAALYHSFVKKDSLIRRMIG